MERKDTGCKKKKSPFPSSTELRGKAGASGEGDPHSALDFKEVEGGGSERGETKEKSQNPLPRGFYSLYFSC